VAVYTALMHMHRAVKIAIFTYHGQHFCFPLDAPAIIMQYVAWMERQFNACQTPCSMYPSIFNSFPVIRTASANNRSFHVLQPTFLFPLDTPLRLSPNIKIAIFTYHGQHFCFPLDAPAIIMQYVAWMERQFNACQTPYSMYPSIFNSFPVVRTASANNRSFHVLHPTFLFPLDTPLRLSPNMFRG